MALTQVIHLTQETYGLPPIIHMVQGDTGRSLMMIIDDVELSGSPTATLYWMRSDLSHYSNNAEYDSQNNAFIADVSQALTQPFNTQCQLKVKDENDLVVSTYTFIINVQADVDGIQASQLGYSAEQLQMMISAAYSGRFSDDAKEALLNLLEHVAYTDEHGQDYLDDLAAALYPPKTLIGISAVYTQTGTIYDNDTLDDLEADLVVTGHYDDLSTETIPDTDYTLSGSLTAGTSIITVTCGEFTTTFNVTVTHMPGTVTITNTLTGCTSSNAAASATEGDSYSATITASSGYTLTGATVSIMMGSTDITSTAYNNGTISITSVTGNLVITVTAVAVTLSSISAVYTQSGTVYNTDSLDSLKSDLVVTATYSDSSTATVASTDYTLSGTLTEGTSTITVSYGGKTTTFTVTVSSAPLIPSEYQQVEYIGFDGNSRIVTDVMPANLNELYRVSATVGVNQATSEEFILGFCGNAARTELYNNAQANKMFYYCGSGAGVTISDIQDLYTYPVDVDIKHDKNGIGVNFDLSVNGNDYNATGTVAGLLSATDHFTFGSGKIASQNYSFKGKIYSCVVYSDLAGTTKIGEFIPCYRKSDGVIGIYDRINEAFYVNAGSGTLTKGSDV